MPVLLFVRQILGVDPDNLAALVTSVGEHVLVALDAVGVVIPQDVSGQEDLEVRWSCKKSTCVPRGCRHSDGRTL